MLGRFPFRPSFICNLKPNPLHSTTNTMDRKQAKILLKALKDPTKVVCIRLRKKWKNFLSCDMERLDLAKIESDDILIHEFKDDGGLYLFQESQVDPKLDLFHIIRK